MIQGTCNNEQKIPFSIRPQTAKGKDVEIDGPPRVSVVSGNCTTEVADDGKTGFIISGEEPGMSQVLIEADADLGEGVVTVSEVIEVTVNGALASNLGVSLGTPVDK